jgi:hypothetical protein
MERILRATNYPNLYGISFYNIEAKTTLGLFTGKIFYFDSFHDRHSKAINEINFWFH